MGTPGATDGIREGDGEKRGSAREAGGLEEGERQNEPGSVGRHRGFEAGTGRRIRSVVGRISGDIRSPQYVPPVQRSMDDGLGSPEDEPRLVPEGLGCRLLGKLHDFTLLHRFDVIES